MGVSMTISVCRGRNPDWTAEARPTHQRAAAFSHALPPRPLKRPPRVTDLEVFVLKSSESSR